MADTNYSFRCYAYRQGEERYVAYCLDLGLIGEGKTMQEAIADLEEAMLGYLESVIELGWEKDLIPRSARPGRWLEFYKLLAIHILKALFTRKFTNFQMFEERFDNQALVYA
ncbi:MAG: type II toxin-antitoxin system HicB family antitoxin [Anaerolineae bacterium]